MFRHHRILYRRLLRGQSSADLLALREESALFPTLLSLIDDELERRQTALETLLNPAGAVSADKLRPFAPAPTAALS